MNIFEHLEVKFSERRGEAKGEAVNSGNMRQKKKNCIQS